MANNICCSREWERRRSGAAAGKNGQEKIAGEMVLRPAIFFDRDGTLNVEVNFLHRVEDFVWIKDAIAAVKYANDNGYLAIVVTNQSGVARGYFGEGEVRRLHDWINGELNKRGAWIDAFYYCPYLPNAPLAEYALDSEYRKPAPGMIRAAIAEFNVDTKKSLMIGDGQRDVDCAEAAGVRGVLFDSGETGKWGGSLRECLIHSLAAIGSAEL